MTASGYKMTELGSLPEEWEVQPLARLGRIYSGGTPSRANPSFWGGAIPWVTTAEIDFGVIRSTKQSITPLGLERSAARLAPPGTLLIAMYGQGKTRGKCAILGIAAAMNQACAAIQAGQTILPRYLLQYLAAHYEDIRALSNYGGQENLSGELVKRIPIAVPPKAEQARIEAFLDDADSLIGILERLIAKKQAIKQAMMQQLLTGKTRLPGYRGNWIHRPLASVLGKLEAGVSVNSVQDLGQCAVLKTSCVSEGVFFPSESKTVAPSDITRARVNPQPDSLVVSRMNTPALVGEVGYVAAYWPNLYLPDRLWLATKIHPVAVDMQWLSYVLSSP